MSTRPSTKKPSDEPVDLSDQESPDISKQFPRLATLTSVEERDASTAINATAAAGLQSRLGERRRMRYDVSMEPLIQERELEGTEGNGLGSEDDDKPAAAKTPYRLPIDDLFGHGISPAAIDVIAATTDTVLLKTCAPVVYDQYKKAVVTIDDLTSRLQTDKPEIYKAITAATAQQLNRQAAG